MSDEPPKGAGTSDQPDEIRDVILKKFGGDARLATVEDIAKIYALLTELIEAIPETLLAATKGEKQEFHVRNLQASVNRIVQSLGKNIVDLSKREGENARER